MKHQWFRSDLVFSLIAVEAIFTAIATIFLCPWWVPMLLGIAAAFAVVEMIQSIVRLRKASYKVLQGYTYKYPLCEMLVSTSILAAITAAIFLTIKGLSAWWIVAVGVVAIALLVYACIQKIDVLRTISVILVVVIALFMANYVMDICVHDGWRLTFFKQNEVVCEHTYGEDGKCVDCGVVCEHTYGEDGKCVDCGVVCEHTYGEDGKCINCGVVNTGDAPAGDNNTNDAPAGDNNTNDAPAGDDNTNDTPAGDDNTDGDKPADGDNTTQPVITPKINAPATIKYAEQIVVTLEGIKAKDLAYGGEDFIAVRELSETEVLITLVGIVNGDEIDFIPTGGYITISDRVSRTGISIKVVE